MNEMFERGFNAGLARAKELVLSFPAYEHGSLKIGPHEVADQVRREIAEAIERIIQIKFD